MSAGKGFHFEALILPPERGAESPSDDWFTRGLTKQHDAQNGSDQALKTILEHWFFGTGSTPPASLPIAAYASTAVAGVTVA